VLRYEVLLAGAVTVTAGLTLLANALVDDGERICAPLGSTAALLAGAAYVVWGSMELSDWVGRVRDGHSSPATATMSDVRDGVLFVGCLLTYAATAALACGLGHRHWIGRRAAGAFLGISSMAFALLLLRGVVFPDPFASTTAWYVRPGFIAGIPAVPWILSMIV
jgi:hypothetical protein